jgi:cytochrome c oxidase subunit 1
MKKLLIIIVLSSLITIIPVFLYWAHHAFVIGLNPFLGFALLFVVLIIAVPFFIFLLRRLGRFLKNKISFTPGVLFSMGFFSFLIADFSRGILFGNTNLDFHLHDTYYVIANAHVLLCFAIFFGIFSGVYHWYPRVFKRNLNDTMGYIHFSITLIGAFLILLTFHFEILAGMPRRYIDYGGLSTVDQYLEMNRLIFKLSFILFAAQLLFAFNFLYSAFKGKRINT